MSSPVQLPCLDDTELTMTFPFTAESLLRSSSLRNSEHLPRSKPSTQPRTTTLGSRSSGVDSRRGCVICCVVSQWESRVRTRHWQMLPILNCLSRFSSSKVSPYTSPCLCLCSSSLIIYCVCGVVFSSILGLFGLIGTSPLSPLSSQWTMAQQNHTDRSRSCLSIQSVC